MKINFLLIYSNFIPLTISLVMPRANISSSAEYKCNNHMACIHPNPRDNSEVFLSTLQTNRLKC
ncbi:hypothetical protein ACB094_10G081800 [Castanea mollissima]